jgi:hypothetical protein
MLVRAQECRPRGDVVGASDEKRSFTLGGMNVGLRVID